MKAVYNKECEAQGYYVSVLYFTCFATFCTQVFNVFTHLSDFRLYSKKEMSGYWRNVNFFLHGLFESFSFVDWLLSSLFLLNSLFFQGA